MTYSEIEIAFNIDLAINNILEVEVQNTVSTTTTVLTESWKNTRSGASQVTLGTPTGIVGETSAINYVAAFNLDYNNTGLYEVSRIDNVVTIKCTDPEIIFQNGIAKTSASPPAILNVMFAYTNNTNPIFSITDVVFSEATNPCDNIKLSVSTSILASNIITPSLGVNTLNPFIFDAIRGTSGTIECESATGDNTTHNYTVPDLLSSANIEINVNNAPLEATVTFAVNYSEGLILQYSIDNVTFQSSNIFNLVPGDYIIYIKDQFGCSVEKAFSVSEFGIQTPHFYLSKSNSIRYANRIEWNNYGNHKTLDNTLSFESEVDLPKMEIQQFQSNDVITTQFESNYETISAVVINEDLTENNIPVVQKTNNIGLKNKRDAKIISIASDPTKTGIYFSSGNLYDFDTGIDTGEDYALNGALPTWGIVGYNLLYNGSWFIIEDVVFDEERNVDLLIIENTYTGTNDVTVQVGSIYNLENYEVYEFEIDFVDYIDKQVNVRINNDDANFINRIELSELIDVKNTQKGTVEIRYKNETNTDILYSTDIEHKIRIPLNRRDSAPKSSLEANDTDTSTVLLNSQSRELTQFTFHPVTEQKMETLVLALLHEIIQINGEFFVSDSVPEIEGAIGDTNWYIVKAKMTKTNNVYNSQGTSDVSSGNIEIPNLLEGSGGFLKY